MAGNGRRQPKNLAFSNTASMRWARNSPAARPIEPQDQCANNARMTIVKIKGIGTHNLDAGNFRQRRKLGRVALISREHDRSYLARTMGVQCREQIALIVVSASPKAARDRGECNTQRALVGQRRRSLNHLT